MIFLFLGDIFDRRLKSFLRCNKMSLEKTKQKLDIYYSGHLLPEFTANKYPLHPRIKQAMESM